MDMQVIKSTTASKHGFGSDKFRSVSGLTKTEKDFVKSGGMVYFGINKTSYMQSGYKIVVHSTYGWDSREPSAEELQIIMKKEAAQ